MNKLIINGKTLFVNENTNLKEILSSEGLLFPCGGKGICGRCKITCKELLPTALDKRFLSEKQLSEGIRLACDKAVTSDLNIIYEKKTVSKPVIKLSECNIAVILGSEKITIGILSDEIMETVEVDNPKVSGQRAASVLRSIIGKESIELFEKYGAARADTIAVAGSGEMIRLLLNGECDDSGISLDAGDYNLPAENLYILPFVNDSIGGEFLCRAIDEPLPRLIIDAGKEFVAGLFDSGDCFCLSHKNVTYGKEDTLAFKASIKLLLDKVSRPPVITLSGNFVGKISELLAGYSYVINENSALEIVAKACNESFYRSKLYKLKKRISVENTADNDEWQDNLILFAKDGNN